MNKLKIIYWVSTALFCAVFLTTGTLYLLHTPFMVKKFHDINFPEYMINFIGVAKILGVTALFFPQVPARLKEWAYAGFTFDLLGAVYCHWLSQDPIGVAPVFVPIAILAVSYVGFRKLNPT